MRLSIKSYRAHPCPKISTKVHKSSSSGSQSSAVKQMSFPCALIMKFLWSSLRPVVRLRPQFWSKTKSTRWEEGKRIGGASEGVASILHLHNYHKRQLLLRKSKAKVIIIYKRYEKKESMSLRTQLLWNRYMRIDWFCSSFISNNSTILPPKIWFQCITLIGRLLYEDSFYCFIWNKI